MITSSQPETGIMTGRHTTVLWCTAGEGGGMSGALLRILMVSTTIHS